MFIVTANAAASRSIGISVLRTIRYASAFPPKIPAAVRVGIDEAGGGDDG